jgi:hypothetical protein
MEIAVMQETQKTLKRKRDGTWKGSWGIIDAAMA